MYTLFIKSYNMSERKTRINGYCIAIRFAKFKRII